MSSDLHFVALIGSNRSASLSRALANTLDELAPDDVQVTILDSVGVLPQYNAELGIAELPEAVAAMGVAIAGADAVVVVTPEYEGSVPGSLRNALDWLDDMPSRPLADKAVAVQTTSRDPFGAVRANDHLRQIVSLLDAVVLNEPWVLVPCIEEKFDRDTGTLRDERTRGMVRDQLASLAKLVRGLRVSSSTL